MFSSPWRWQDNRVETYRSYAKDFNHKLRIIAFVVFTWFIYCIIMHRISNVKYIRMRFPFLILGLTTEAYAFFVRCILTRKEKIVGSNIFVDLNFVPWKQETHYSTFHFWCKAQTWSCCRRETHIRSRLGTRICDGFKWRRWKQTHANRALNWHITWLTSQFN